MPALSARFLSQISGKHLYNNRDQGELWCSAAVFAAPERDSLWFNLGLFYKRQGRWSASQQANTCAVHLNSENEGAWWNLGIAATASNDGQAARRAWAACGIELPSGVGLPDMDLGLTPIRLQPDGDSEVVWTTRLDPARARIESVPFPTSGRRHGDIVLHDGYPDGERIIGEQSVPVFNELALLIQSPHSTFHAIVRTALKDNLADLDEWAERHGVVAQNWTSSTRMLPHEESYGLAPIYQQPEPTGEAEMGIAARSEAEAQAFLTAWAQSQPLREVLDFHLGLAGSNAKA